MRKEVQRSVMAAQRNAPEGSRPSPAQVPVRIHQIRGLLLADHRFHPQPVEIWSVFIFLLFAYSLRYAWVADHE